MAKQKTSPLRAFDRLVVGPVRVEARKMVAPYTVVRGREEATTELAYRFEEPVFDPDSPACHNLAGLMAAQVALNYGLFCDELVFRLPLSAADRSFLQDMAENTAREIYVNKILAPNRFLVASASELPAEKQERYLQAELRFDQPIDEPPAWLPAVDARRRCCILSSGGKDSLLTHGLLDEIGWETHPIFVNESGRHWHTALNAFRHFEMQVPRTARVWTNADRVFSWMLRQLPFVRPDFAQLRSDDYPIRLWTVAVFLFGALPLVRRRGLGWLLVGDEFDTTVRRNHRGIPHYDGLYDQSRYFDKALTRFFRRKGWALSQLSVLRPLGELLIEKILVERYPELQRHQMSCHATHTEEGRVRPCGSCEKCRRVVGMLLAVGADPSRCGYDAAQIERCLKGIAEHGVHQERAGAEHLCHALRQLELLPPDVDLATPAREHPEILAVRLDRDRSPLDLIPRDLREPLYQIYLEHAHGAVRLVGKQWAPFALLSNESLAPPSHLEGPRSEVPPPMEQGRADNDTADDGGTPQRSQYLLGELSWPLAKQRLAKMDVALLPVGAIEQHGPHLPLDTDAFDADYLAHEIAKACSDPKPLVLPLIAYGVSYHHDDFAGTISINNDTLRRLVYDIGMSVAQHGINKLVILNGHGGNAPALQFAAQMINRDARIFTCVDTGESSDHDLGGLCETPNDVHAGEIETSTSLATRPHLVDMDRASKMVPRFSSRYLDFSARRRVEWYARTAKLSRTGVLGDPTKANAEKGRQMWAIMIANLVELVEDLKRMTLKEIYARRY